MAVATATMGNSASMAAGYTAMLNRMLAATTVSITPASVMPQ